MKISWDNFCIDLSRKTHVMGILNITPDSFSDGGLHLDVSKAVDRGLQMVDEGADIIDVGGESTRPGSDPVSADEELRRVLPVIEGLAGRIPVPVCIDTCKARVAGRAVEAGASMINDVSGLRFDPEMPKTAASTQVPVVIMHMKGTPKSMQVKPHYEALIPEIMDYFRMSMRLARNCGVRDEMMILDPGIGFGKSFDHNLQIIANLDAFLPLERPILIGPSRKAFIGRLLDNAPADQRLEGTAAVVAAAIIKGAHIIRVHDVKEMVKVARVADAIKRERVD